MLTIFPEFLRKLSYRNQPLYLSAPDVHFSSAHPIYKHFKIHYTPLSFFREYTQRLERIFEQNTGLIVTHRLQKLSAALKLQPSELLPHLVSSLRIPWTIFFDLSWARDRNPLLNLGKTHEPQDEEIWSLIQQYHFLNTTTVCYTTFSHKTTVNFLYNNITCSLSEWQSVIKQNNSLLYNDIAFLDRTREKQELVT